MQSDQDTSFKSLRLLWALALPGYLADQATKAAVVEHIAVGIERLEVIPGIFWINHVRNTGVAFGMANGGSYSNLVFGTIAGITCAIILILWRKGQFHTVTGRTAGALLVAGAIGNLTDRIVHAYVVDWVTVNLGFMIWPSFNLADAYICIAAGLLILSSFQRTEDQSIHDGESSSPGSAD